jgi:hypothetical protein
LGGQGSHRINEQVLKGVSVHVSYEKQGQAGLILAPHVRHFFEKNNARATTGQALFSTTGHL